MAKVAFTVMLMGSTSLFSFPLTWGRFRDCVRSLSEATLERGDLGPVVEFSCCLLNRALPLLLLK